MTALRSRFKKFTSILSKEQTEIVETALLLMLPALLTKFSGLFFNLIAASYFGAHDPAWNKFLLASSIPDMLTNVLLGGAIASVIIPTLIACRKKEGQQAFFELYNSVINGLLVIFVVVSFIVALSAHALIPFLLKTLGQGDTTLSPADLDLVVNMMRLLLLPQIILGISVLISSGLNIYNRYLVPQLAPLIFNIGRIAGLVVLLPLMHNSPWAIVVGVICGSILHLVVQIPLYRYLGFKYELKIKWNKYLKNMLIHSFPRTLALAAENIGLTINDFLAYTVSANAIASLNYANSLSLVIPTLFAAPFAYASFTILSELFEDGDYKKAQTIIIKTLNEILFLALPFIVTLMILRVPIIRLVFGIISNTRFTLDDTYSTAWILLWFTVGHVFVCGRWFMYRVFYAAKDTMVPFIVSTLSLVLTVVFSILFTNLFSHSSDYAISRTQITIANFLTRGNGPAAAGGIALGMSLAYSLEFFALIIIFNFKTLKLNFKLLLKTVSYKFAAGAGMLALMYIIYKTWDFIAYALPVSATESYFGSTTLNLIVLTTLTVVTGFALYYLLCLLFKVEELRILKKYLNPIFKVIGLSAIK